MFAEPINVWATSAFGLLCFVTGMLVTILLLKRRQPRRETRNHIVPLTYEVEEFIDHQARQWAINRGTPWAAGIAAPYAKLLARMQAQRGGGGLS